LRENGGGNLGHGNVLNRYKPTLVRALHGIRVVGVSIYYEHALALAANGSVYASGEGFALGIRIEGEGEEARGTTRTRTPKRIPDLVCMVQPR
jgi:alpha-tubulin suppressor-like RCC1 family protein